MRLDCDWAGKSNSLCSRWGIWSLKYYSQVILLILWSSLLEYSEWMPAITFSEVKGFIGGLLFLMYAELKNVTNFAQSDQVLVLFQFLQHRYYEINHITVMKLWCLLSQSRITFTLDVN